jgi:hypothetical protein
MACGLVGEAGAQSLCTRACFSTRHLAGFAGAVDKLPVFYTRIPVVFRPLVHNVFDVFSSVKAPVLPIIPRPYKENNKEILINSYLYNRRFA